MIQYEKEFEEYENWKSNEESIIKRIVRNIEVKHVILIIILVILFFILMQNKKDDKIFFIIGGGIIALIFFLTFKTTSEKRLLKEELVKRIVLETLKAKRGIEDWIPHGSHIELTGYCALRLWGDDYYKWEVGARIIRPDGYIDERMIAVHPYDGFIMKIQATPTGYDATEAPDIKPVYAFEYYSPKNVPPSYEKG